MKSTILHFSVQYRSDCQDLSARIAQCTLTDFSFAVFENVEIHDIRHYWGLVNLCQKGDVDYLD